MNTTEKLSPGYASEIKTARFLESRGWVIEFHDIRICRVQVDLLVRDPVGILTLVEVKTQSHAHQAHVTKKQWGRLRRVADFLSEFEPIEMILALVHDEDVQILPVDGLTDF